jgi:hypothetical protein
MNYVRNLTENINYVSDLNENIKYGYIKSPYGGSDNQKYLYKLNSNNISIDYDYRHYQYDDRETINIRLEFEILDENEKILKLKNLSMEHDNIYGGGFHNFTYNYNHSVNYIFKYEIINNIFNIKCENLVTNILSYNQEIFNTIEKINIALEYIKNIDLTKY